MGFGPIIVRIAREVYENARKDRATFFEAEGLQKFLHLDWDIEVDKNQVLEFIESYQQKNRKATLSTGEIILHDELLREVFHLPSGAYKMRKTKKTSKVVSPYFPASSASTGTPRGGLLPDDGFLLVMCTDEAWGDRLSFLHLLFSIKTKKREIIPYFFVEFLQTEGKKRNWLDVFKWFFDAEIARLKRSKGTKTSTSIGTHVSLLLAHFQKKREQAEGPQQKRRVSIGQINRMCPVDPQSDDSEVQNHQEEVAERQTRHPSPDIDNVEDQILRHHDMARQGIAELLNRMAALRKEMELWKNECGIQIAARLNKKDSSKLEVEKWKNEAELWRIECGKVERGRMGLEEKVTAFWAITKLGTPVNTRPLPEDHASSEFATPPLSKKAKLPNLTKTEIEEN